MGWPCFPIGGSAFRPRCPDDVSCFILEHLWPKPHQYSGSEPKHNARQHSVSISGACQHYPTTSRSADIATDRYQRGLDRMMELVSAEHSNTFDHVKLVES